MPRTSHDDTSPDEVLDGLMDAVVSARATDYIIATKALLSDADLGGYAYMGEAILRSEIEDRATAAARVPPSLAMSSFNFASRAAEMLVLGRWPTEERLLTPTQLNELLKTWSRLKDGVRGWHDDESYKAALDVLRTATRKFVTTPYEQRPNYFDLQSWANIYVNSLSTDAPAPTEVEELIRSPRSLMAYAERVFKARDAPLDEFAKTQIREEVERIGEGSPRLRSFPDEVREQARVATQRRITARRNELRELGKQYLASEGYDVEMYENANVLSKAAQRLAEAGTTEEAFKRYVIERAYSPRRDWLARIGSRAVALATLNAGPNNPQYVLIADLAHKGWREGWDDKTFVDAALQTVLNKSYPIAVEQCYDFSQYETFVNEAARRHLKVNTDSEVNQVHSLVGRGLYDFALKAYNVKLTQQDIERNVREFFDALPARIRSHEIEKIFTPEYNRALSRFGKLELPPEVEAEIRRLSEDCYDNPDKYASYSDAPNPFHQATQEVIEREYKVAIEEFLRDKTRLPPHPDAAARGLEEQKDKRSLKSDTSVVQEGHRFNSEFGMLVTPCDIRSLSLTAAENVRRLKRIASQPQTVSPAALRNELWNLLEAKEVEGDLPQKEDTALDERYFGGGRKVPGGTEGLAAQMCNLKDGEDKAECTRTVDTLRRWKSPWLYCDQSRGMEKALNDRYGNNAEMKENPLRKLNGRRIDVVIPANINEMGSDGWWGEYGALDSIDTFFDTTITNNREMVVEDGLDGLKGDAVISATLPFIASGDPSHVGVIYWRDVKKWLDVEGKTPEMYGGQENYDYAVKMRKTYDSIMNDATAELHQVRSQTRMWLADLLGNSDPKYVIRGGGQMWQHFNANRKTVLAQNREKAGSAYEDARISTVLTKMGADKKLLDVLTQLPTATDEKLSLVFSTEPADILHKSTDQSWTSCEAYSGNWMAGPPDDVRYHNAVVWLRKQGEDKNIGRTMLRWCKDDTGKMNVGMEPRIYPLHKEDKDAKKMEILQKAITDELRKEGLGEFVFCKTPYIYNGYIDTHNYIEHSRYGKPSAEGRTEIYYGDYDKAVEAQGGRPARRTSSDEDDEDEDDEDDTVDAYDADLTILETLDSTSLGMYSLDGKVRLVLKAQAPDLRNESNTEMPLHYVRNSDRILTFTADELAERAAQRNADDEEHIWMHLSNMNSIERDTIIEAGVTTFITAPAWGYSARYEEMDIADRQSDQALVASIEEYQENLAQAEERLGQSSDKYVLLKGIDLRGNNRQVYLLPLRSEKIRHGLAELSQYNYSAPMHIRMTLNDAEGEDVHPSGIVENLLLGRGHKLVVEATMHTPGDILQVPEESIPLVPPTIEAVKPVDGLAELDGYTDKEFASVCRQFMRQVLPETSTTIYNASALVMYPTGHSSNYNVYLGRTVRGALSLNLPEFLEGDERDPVAEYVVKRCNGLGYSLRSKADNNVDDLSAEEVAKNDAMIETAQDNNIKRHRIFLV